MGEIILWGSPAIKGNRKMEQSWRGMGFGFCFSNMREITDCLYPDWNDQVKREILMKHCGGIAGAILLSISN